MSAIQGNDIKMRADDEWRWVMFNAPMRTVFDVITDFLASEPTPEEIIAYQLPDDLQERAHELLDKNGEGELTPEERGEMFDYVRMERYDVTAPRSKCVSSSRRMKNRLA